MSREIRRILVAMMLGLALPAVAFAQPHQQDHAPYADHTARQIKALSEAEIHSLVNAEGMGMALPAELNGYPGPRHVLDLADELHLTSDQREETQAIFDAMQSAAVELGKDVIDLERALDEAFAEGTIDSAALAQYVEQIQLRRSELRRVHLQAHLDLYPVLSTHQRAAYDRLRGYAHTH